MEELHFLPDGRILVSAWPSYFSMLNKISDVSYARNIYADYPFKGSPYWITEYKGSLIIPEIGGFNGIGLWSYGGRDFYKISNIVEFTSPNESDLSKKSQIRFQVD